MIWYCFIPVDDVVATELGPHVKRFECQWHVRGEATAIKTKVAGHAGGNALITEFINELLYKEQTEDEFMATWAALRPKYPRMPDWVFE